MVQKRKQEKEFSQLSTRQLQVLPYLLISPTYEEAALRSGVSIKQLYAWLKNPVFQAELKKQQNALFWDGLLALKIATIKAVQTLVSSLNDPDAKIRLSAAEQILSKAFTGELYELEDRLQAVEGRIDNQSKKLVNKHWLTRIEAIESKSEALCEDELLDKWISENCANKDWTYLAIVNVVPNKLKDVCFRRAMEEVEGINFSRESSRL